MLPVLRDQDLAEALDSSSSDMEMEKGVVQVQEQSAQHRAKMWKVIRKINTRKLIYLICKGVRNKLRTEVIPHVDKEEIFFCQTQWNRLERLERHIYLYMTPLQDTPSLLLPESTHLLRVFIYNTRSRRNAPFHKVPMWHFF